MNFFFFNILGMLFKKKKVWGHKTNIFSNLGMKNEIFNSLDIQISKIFDKNKLLIKFGD